MSLPHVTLRARNGVPIPDRCCYQAITLVDPLRTQRELLSFLFRGRLYSAGMTPPHLQDQIDRVEATYKTWVLGSIKRTYEATKDTQEKSTPLAAFILVSCAIDFLAGFMCGITSFSPQPGESSKNYKAFVTKYLPQYDPVDVYNHIRCRLAHNYTIGGDVALTHRNLAAHDPCGTKGRKIINFENFFADFQEAASAYFKELASDSALQAKFANRYPLGLVAPKTVT